MPAERSPIQDAVDLLDAKGPKDWRKKIDVTKLCMLGVEDDILGQLYGLYHMGKEALGLTSFRVTGMFNDHRDAWVAECQRATEAPYDPMALLKSSAVPDSVKQAIRAARASEEITVTMTRGEWRGYWNPKILEALA